MLVFGGNVLANIELLYIIYYFHLCQWVINEILQWFLCTHDPYSFWIVTAEMEIVYFALCSDGMSLSDYKTVLNNKNKFFKKQLGNENFNTIS